MAACMRSASGRDCSAAPPCSHFHFGTGKWSPWFDYQLAALPNFPYFYHSDHWTWDGVVPVLCDDSAHAASAGDACTNRLVGGNSGFGAGTTVNMSVPLSGARIQCTIHYTTDGSEPTAASPLYSAPVRLDRSTVVQARALVDGRALPLTTKPHFTKGKSKS